ncbi:NADP-dependent oxidoreductase [Nonomuraea sp. NPDC003707]
MKALAASGYGAVDQLRVSDVPERLPASGEVLVRVQAAALNPLDIKLVTGELRELFPVTHPFVPGMDATGVVTAVGEGVSRFAVGDEVIAYAGAVSGMLAEYAVITDGPHITHRPSALPPIAAAALPTVAMTAHCVVTAARIEPGESVLIIGATGGVGALVTQHAAQAGARVLATAAPADAAYIQELGAETAIDYTRGPISTDADVVVDLINAGPALASTAVLVRQRGRLISTLYGPAEVDGVVPVYVWMDPATGDLPGQAASLAADRISIEVAATYSFAQSMEAMRDFAAGTYTRGKIAITL